LAIAALLKAYPDTDRFVKLLGMLDAALKAPLFHGAAGVRDSFREPLPFLLTST